MASYPASSYSTDTEIWHSLKQAIAASSGFRRWQLEHKAGSKLTTASLDHQVQGYLRETLETLAY
ncbi:MAG: hypothetical protein VKJ46_04670 [Leptolyngbyaceae bacterium]|nr:hypothetical protein [Leptolyngbyaceae bacterium]